MDATRLAVLAALVGSLLVGCASNRQLLAERDAEIASLREHVGQLEERMNGLERERAEADARAQRLEAELRGLAGGGEVETSRVDRTTMLRVPDQLLFASGSATISADGRKLLDDLASIVERYPERDVRIEGHTDNVPIGVMTRNVFPSNWELSTARATAIVRYLIENENIGPRRLVAVGYGEHRPISPNDTPENRARNRRVEFYLVPTLPVSDVSP